MIKYYQNKLDNDVWTVNMEVVYQLLHKNRPKQCSKCKTTRLSKEFYTGKKVCKKCFKIKYKQNKK